MIGRFHHVQACSDRQTHITVDETTPNFGFTRQQPDGPRIICRPQEKRTQDRPRPSRTKPPIFTERMRVSLVLHSAQFVEVDFADAARRLATQLDDHRDDASYIVHDFSLGQPKAGLHRGERDALKGGARIVGVQVVNEPGWPVLTA